MNKKNYSHATWIEVDLARFQNNLAVTRRAIGKNVKLCLPVKANAYGHGLAAMVSVAENHVDYFAVSCLQEGMQLRELGIQKPILMLGAVDTQQILEAIEHDITLTIVSSSKVKKVSEAAKFLNKIAPIHIEIETGMQRTGMRVDSAMPVIEYALSDPWLSLKGIYSHFATADTPNDPHTQMQIQQFSDFIKPLKERYPELICHMANSGGVMYYPESYFDMVRPGILIFGHVKAAATLPKFAEIQPFFSLKSRVTFFKVVAAGSGISYGHTYKTTQQTRIITIPIGYGDGYRRALSQQGNVLIRGNRYPIAGTICMDQLMVDIGNNEVFVGDEVTLIGADNNESITVQEIATLCDTIPYEILCGFNERMIRKYIK
jgi:alanine racemase